VTACTTSRAPFRAAAARYRARRTSARRARRGAKPKPSRRAVRGLREAPPRPARRASSRTYIAHAHARTTSRRPRSHLHHSNLLLAHTLRRTDAASARDRPASAPTVSAPAPPRRAIEQSTIFLPPLSRKTRDAKYATAQPYFKSSSAPYQAPRAPQRRDSARRKRAPKKRAPLFPSSHPTAPPRPPRLGAHAHSPHLGIRIPRTESREQHAPAARFGRQHSRAHAAPP
jgi:hypothetical protein